MTVLKVGFNKYKNNDATDPAKKGNKALLSREKYMKLAQEARSLGDRVAEQNYLQFADHYARVMAEFKPAQTKPALKVIKSRPEITDLPDAQPTDFDPISDVGNGGVSILQEEEVFEFES